jgi:uncharacterized protein YbaA (DUF1428 family)
MVAVVALSMSLLGASSCTDNSTGPVGVAPGTSVPPVASDEDFDPTNFTHPTEITNPYFPLVAGTRFTWEGHATDEGERLRRKVVFTVTDLTKVIDGVRTVVAWDRDYTDGELEEVELTFFAQDDDGTIWYFGEYPEELDGDTIVKTPTWIPGVHGARAGVMMQAAPRLGNPSYAEGWGGTDVNWTDRGKVHQVGQLTCVPLDCYSDVVVIDEFNPEEPGAHQLKYFAPGVGGIRVGWRGAKEEEREVLNLVSLEQLSPEEMDELRRTVLEQEARAYRLSPDVYGTTEPIDQS